MLPFDCFYIKEGEVSTQDLSDTAAMSIEETTNNTMKMVEQIIVTFNSDSDAYTVLMNGEMFCFTHTLYAAQQLIKQTISEEYTTLAKSDVDGWTIHNLSLSDDTMTSTVTRQDLGRISLTNGTPYEVLKMEIKRVPYAHVVTRMTRITPVEEQEVIVIKNDQE